MDFSLTTEQGLFRDSLGRFLRDSYTAETRRKIAATDGFDRANWAKFAELGWVGMPFDEAEGGFAGSPVKVMILMETFGRGLVLEPYLTTVVLCGGLIQRSGTSAQKEALLPAVIGGELFLIFAYAERQSRFNLADVQSTAKPHGDGFVINGRKSVVFDAASADKIIVSARTGGAGRDSEGITLFVVDSDAPELTRRDFRTVDGGRASEIEFADVPVESGAIVGELDQALQLIECTIDHGIAAVCAEAVGVMTVLHESTIDYLKTRKNSANRLVISRYCSTAR